LRFQGK